MAGRLKNEDLFDPDILIPMIERAEALEIALKKILGTSKDLIKNHPIVTGKQK